jgi:hypothetical protein
MSTELAEGTIDGYTDTLSLTHHRRENNMFENSEAFSEEYQGLPDPDHLDTVMDGMLDTVAGNEGLTYAQHYLHSCLQTSGSISSRQGTEGFFESVGNGIKTAWEYVMKMFASIWNFFFGSSDSGESKGETKAKKESDETIKAFAMIAAPKGPEETKEVLNNLKTQAKKVVKESSSSSDTSKAKAIVEQIETLENKPGTPSASEVKHIADEVVNVSKEDQTRLKAAIQAFQAQNAKFEAALVLPRKKGVRSTGTTALHDKLMTELEEPASHLDKLAKALKTDITSVDQAKALQKQVKDCLDAKQGVSAVINRHKTDVQKIITDMKNKTNGVAHTKEEEDLSKEIESTKKMLSVIANAARASELVHTAVSGISKINRRLVGA